MTNLPILITGTNRGLGLEFVNSYLSSGRTVIATCREPEKATELSTLKAQYKEQLEIVALEVGDANSRQNLIDTLNGQALDTYINNAGVYGGQQQNFGEVEEDKWLETLKINSIAPLMLSQALMPNLLQGQHKTIAFLSSKMGSIDDNGSGQCYIYRSSKTTLNSVARSMSIDLKGQGVRVLIMHPGWVKTDMGGDNGLIDTQTSVNGMRQTIDRNVLEDSGNFFNYDGAHIAW